MASTTTFVACATRAISAGLLSSSHGRNRILPGNFKSRRGLRSPPLQLSCCARLRSCDRAVPGRRKMLWTLVPHATVKEESPEQVAAVQTSTLKEFLEDLKSLGRVRLIVNTGVAVLESVTFLEKLYYHVSARGEYANLMSREDNVDFHLLLEKVACARLVKGKSPKDIPTYMVRLVGVNDTVALSVLVMWNLGTAGEYDPGQVEGFEALLNKYGEEVTFRRNEIN